MTLNIINTATTRSSAPSTAMMADGFPADYYSLDDYEEHINEDIQSPLADALKLASKLEAERLKLEVENKALTKQLADSAEKQEFYDQVAESSHLFDIDEAAKIMETGRTRLFVRLRELRVLKSSQHRRNMPYQKYLDDGLFEVKHLQYRNRNTGELQLKSMPFFTGKGLIWLQKFIAKHGRFGL